MIPVLVVGQTPPPHHGQAVMTQHLLRGQFREIQLHHVRMAFSGSIDDVGRFRLGKLFHLVAVVACIVYHRLRHNTKVLYYLPASPNRVPLYRDFAILLCTRWLFRRTVFHFHATGIASLYPRLTKIERFLFRRALFYPDTVVAIAQCGREDARLLQPKQEFIVPNGIEDEGATFLTRTDKQEQIEQGATSVVGSGNQANHFPKRTGQDAVGLLDEPATTVESRTLPLQILFVGMLSEAKGVLTLLEACGHLAARGVPFHLKLMGQFQSAAFSVMAKNRIEELGISAHVTFLGVASGVAKWEAFARSDVVCLPTHYEAETFPTVLLEAMSLARPVVATRWRGILEIVDDGTTGFLVPTRDSTSVADRLAALASDSELRDRMGKAGRQKFIGEFTVGRFVQNMEKVFLETAKV